MGVIFDLDQTLVESLVAKQDRQSRNWNTVYSRIPHFRVYDNIMRVLKLLDEKNIPVCIVTSSPSSYCEKVLSYFGIKVHFSICYHDSKNHKPHPEPIEIAKDKLISEYGCRLIISIGYTPADILASKKADVTSIAANWGSEESELLKQTDAEHIFESPLELYNWLYNF